LLDCTLVFCLALLTTVTFAFQLEHGFWQTPMGKETYLMNLKQISEACIETCAYGVIHALLSSRSHYNQWENMFGNGNQVPFADLFKRQKFEFALFQRNPKGAYVLDAQVKDMARDVGVAFDTIVLPPKVAIYLSLCTSWGTEAYRRGAAAMEKALNTAPANYNSFRGSNVHECYKFDEHFENSVRLRAPRRVAATPPLCRCILTPFCCPNL
jgi:hypothetical protein